jgi:glycosyltransferase
MNEAAVSPWLTIVTVVKDDAPGFERTLASIAQQDLYGVEWIIIDSSTDTNALPALLASEAMPTSHYAWTEPHGIYPAMNAGLAQATGAYIYFLNAGDSFADPKAVAAIKTAAEPEPAWLYGQVRFVDDAGKAVTPTPFDYAAEKASSFSRGRFPPHQGIIASKDALAELGGFDTSYRIAADYAVFLGLSLLADPVEMSDVIADFYVGGLSSTAWGDSVGEFHRARTEILHPTGWCKVTELAATAVQYSSLAAYHVVVSPLRRRRDWHA